MIIPVILSGGSGTRLWPISRKLHPKQFIALYSEKTLLQETLLRLPNKIANPLIVCSEEHRFLAAEQLRQINIVPDAIILEPFGRNTAPAVALAAFSLVNKNQDCTLLILSADHHIQDDKTFHKAISVAKKHSDLGKLVTFGVKPSRPETGYGYIEADFSDKSEYYSIKSFTEKPDLKNAKVYCDSGNYFWNCGMFMFKASTFLKELEKFQPEIFSICKKALISKHLDRDFIRIDNNLFKKCPSISIDYAVMEKTANGVVIPLNSQWSDIGSWDSLWSIRDKDDKGNVLEGDILLEDVHNSYIQGSNRLIATIGIENLIIIDTQDSLLVANMEYSQKINSIVKKLNQERRDESKYHRKVYRPWGYYNSIDSGPGYQVKKLFIKPGSKISLQKHYHRSEHWVVIKGVALITNGEQIIELKENESTFIAKGEIHRLENEKEDPLEIIEIQTGDYLGEDDITRFEDEYNRD